MLTVEAERSPEALSGAMRSIEAAFLIGVPGTTEVWLVRHGDCYDDVPGTGDPSLSPRGREQAAKLADRLNRIGYDALYASPLRRALETALSVTSEFQLDDRLVEVRTTLEDGRVEVAEQPEQVLARISAAVSDAVATYPGGRVIMVGHGVAILGYLCDVLRLEFGSLRVLPYYTSISTVRVLGERRMVGSLADVAHLEA